MRILLLSPRNPYPTDDGGKMGILNPALEFARQGHKVALFFLHHNEVHARDSVQYLSDLGILGIPFEAQTKDSVLRLIVNVGDARPFKMAKYFHEKALSALLERTADLRPDVVQAQHPHMAEYALRIRETLRVPIVLREHNIEYALVRQYVAMSKNPILKVLARWQYLKTRRYERRLWTHFDAVAFITETDAREAGRGSNVRAIHIVTDGVAVPRRTPARHRDQEPVSVLFTGNMHTVQNLGAMDWFIRHVWPRIHRTRPDARLYVTGASVHLLLRSLNATAGALEAIGVRLLGYVPDVGEVMRRCQVFVSPTQMGSGIRLKVLQAMAFGMPVVCTPLDAAGVSAAVSGRHLIVAELPEEFERAICRLFDSDEERRSLGREARALMSTRYSWERSAQGLSKVFASVVRHEDLAYQ